VAFLLITLLIESLSLVIVVSHSRPFSSLLVAARIKSASYLLGILNFALGAGALTVLLRRRVPMSLADAAGAILVIGLFDFGSLIALVVVTLSLMGSAAAGVKAGVVIGAGTAIVAGFALLRAPVKMGAFDRIRELQIFHSARTLPIGLLGKLGLLRCAFVGSYMILAAATMWAFDVEVPWLTLIVNVSIMLLVAALPLAAAGLGTGQVVFVSLFEPWAPAETLLAASLLLSLSLISTRFLIGLAFAREFANEALAEVRDEQP
jgi:uncharacterized membrane protein YbhN (UPF0104 family)